MSVRIPRLHFGFCLPFIGHALGWNVMITLTMATDMMGGGAVAIGMKICYYEHWNTVGYGKFDEE